MMAADRQPLLRVEGLKVYFRTANNPIRAVDGADFTIREGETVALVGESGCGKSVTALALARLLPHAGYVAGGRIQLGDSDILALRESDLRAIRGSDLSYVFQEPATSLNPVFRVGFQIREALRLHRRDVNAREEAERLLQLVGIPDPAHRLDAYPHQLSGGMQQRVMMAMALACRPRLLVADEPTTALDVTIQAQILDLLQDLQRQLGMAILLITHNLGLVAGVADRVNVMYAGRIVESGPVEPVLRRPLHPYTQGLLAAVPRLNTAAGRLTGIRGTVPSPQCLPPGCPFHPRCDRADDLCRRLAPETTETDEPGRSVRCHYWKPKT